MNGSSYYYCYEKNILADMEKIQKCMHFISVTIKICIYLFNDLQWTRVIENSCEGM